MRALVGGAVITLAVVLSRSLNPLWGGVFSVFPATYVCSFNFIALNSRDMLVRIARTIPQGSIAFLLYVVFLQHLYSWGLFAGTIVSEALVIVCVYSIARASVFESRT